MLLPLSRKRWEWKVFDRLSQKLSSQHTKPVEIVRFRFSHALDSMFSDRSLMKPPNLVINQPSSGKDPYALYESPGNLLNEVHSGSSFQNAYWYDFSHFFSLTRLALMVCRGLVWSHCGLPCLSLREVCVLTALRGGLSDTSRIFTKGAVPKTTTQTCKCRLTSWHCCMVVFPPISLRFIPLFSQLCRATNSADFTFAWTKY